MAGIYDVVRAMQEADRAKREAGTNIGGYPVTPGVKAVADAMTGLVTYPREYMEGKATRSPVDWAADVSTGMMGMGSAFPAGANDLRMGIKAYHGSPHDFDKFDMSKIGTGEGAQAYGHGLYFAESPQVAQSYKELGKQYDRPIEGVADVKVPNWIANRLDNGENPQAFIDDFKGRIQEMRTKIDDGSDIQPWNSESNIVGLQRIIDGLEEVKVGRAKLAAPGRQYEVSINANPDEFLDWDLPLSQQPKAVQDLLGYAPRPSPEEEAAVFALAKQRGVPATELPEYKALEARMDAAARLDRSYPTGGNIYESNKIVPGDFRDQAAATEALRAAGIKGIRYKDAGSRGAEGGTSNFVVFDDKIVDILKKYGIAGLLAAGLGPEVAKQVGQKYGQAPGTEVY